MKERGKRFPSPAAEGAIFCFATDKAGQAGRQRVQFVAISKLFSRYVKIGLDKTQRIVYTRHVK